MTANKDGALQESLKCDLLQMQRNANRTFTSAAMVLCIVGSLVGTGAGLLVGAGVVEMIRKGTITAPTLIIATGILVAVLAAVFFYWYNRLVIRMAAYHQKLFLAHNVNLALRTADEIPVDAPEKNVRAFAKKEVAKELVQDINKLLAADPPDRPTRG